MSQYEIRHDFECQCRNTILGPISNVKKRKTKSENRKANNQKQINNKRNEKIKKRKTNQLHLALIEVFMRSVGTINVLKVRTLIYFYFSAVRNFRNCFRKKRASVRNFRMRSLS